MPPLALALVLLSATLHATWNLLIARSRDTDVTTAVAVPIGALIVLLIGWIVGRLLGRIVRILLDKIADTSMVKSIGLMGTAEKSGITLGYIGDILVRLIVYLIAILAAVDILNMDYLSALMTKVVFYIPSRLGRTPRA